jgi:transcriptional antiterminator RfaH
MKGDPKVALRTSPNWSLTMPILAEETSLYPESLLDQVDEDSTRDWWVLYTKARQEKALARQLISFEVPFYLPLVSKENYFRGHRVHSYLPLFAGYVFLFANDAERVRSLTTNRISYMLYVSDPWQLRQDLLQISQLIASDAPLTVEKRLQPGQRVRVRNGPLVGMEGTLVTRRGRSKLLVLINFLGQGASVEINDFQLEPV